MKVSMLGPLRMGGADAAALGRKPQALLVYLCRRAGVEVPRETLCGLLWGDRSDAQARASLRQALSALRKSLGTGAEAVTTSNAGARVDPGRIEIDAAAFEAAAASGDVGALERAAELYTGDLMEGAPPVEPEFDRWLSGERAALRALFLRVLTQLLAQYQEAQRHEDAIAVATRLIAADPLQETVHRRLMQSYASQGRYDAALKQFEDLRGVLDAELGIAPEPQTAELAKDIRARRRGPAEAPAAPRPAAPAVPSRPSVAVLPFRVLSRDEDAAYFGEGVAEDILIELSRTPDLMVVARQSSFRFGADEADPIEVGQALGVRYCLTGSVRAAGPRLRVSAHLVSCEDGHEIWADRYDREAEDIFEIQTEIARMVTGAAVGRMIEAASARARSDRPDDMAAYDLVLRGLKHLNGYTPGDLTEARGLFERAIATDPGYARPHGLLALSILYKRWYFDVEAEMGDVIVHAERCIAMDPGDAKGHCALGMARMIHREFDRAGYHFEAALARNPNDDHLMVEHARFLMYDERADEGIRRVREAMRLNPYHPDWYWNIYGRLLHTLGRFDEALQMFERIPTPAFFVEAYLAACRQAMGEAEAAARHRDRAYALNPEFRIDRFLSIFPYRNPETAERFFASLRAAGFS